MPNTVENLKSAFAGESQANRKYLAFAKKADEEGLSPGSQVIPRCRRSRNYPCSQSFQSTR